MVRWLARLSDINEINETMHKPLIGIKKRRSYVNVTTNNVFSYLYRVPPPPPPKKKKKNGTVDTVDFSGLCSDQQLYLFTLLNRSSFLIIITQISSNLVENFLFYK